MSPPILRRMGRATSEHDQFKGGLSSWLHRRAEECVGDKNHCEKPVSTSSLTVPITVGVVVPVVFALALLLYLHRRNIRKQRLEDRNDPTKGLDFGIDPSLEAAAAKKKRARKSTLFGSGEKNPAHDRQISMDMNLSSPYLLPPKLQQSGESLHTLARSIHSAEDPYKPVHVPQSDSGSIRSKGAPKDAQSIRSYAATATATPGAPQHPMPTHDKNAALPPMPPPAARSGAQTPPPPVRSDASDPFSTAHNTPDDASRRSASHNYVPPYPDSESVTAMGPPNHDMSVPRDTQSEYPSINHDHPEKPWNLPAIHPTDHTFPFSDTPSQIPSTSHGPSYDHDELHMSAGPNQTAPQQVTSLPEEDESVYESRRSLPTIQMPTENEYEKFDFGTAHGTQSGTTTTTATTTTTTAAGKFDFDDEEEVRGRSQVQARESKFGASLQVAEGAGAKRLSIGLRPLPPDEIMDVEDPEYRANRIRSFYKEYFDDGSKDPQGTATAAGGGGGNGHGAAPPGDGHGVPGGRGPVSGGPGGPPQYGTNRPQYGNVDPTLAGPNAPYFDPLQNSFVMPYAQPVTRRAMTPPPRGRMPMGGGPGGGGPRGPPSFRTGSPMSNYAGPRPGSSVSNRFQGPSRPGSSASGRLPRRANLPPPEPLSTLPNPAKLADDSLALFSVTDFAPPDSFADVVVGRSQSPGGGERKPYQYKGGASPLVSSYDELPAVPSPHLLRRSGTFTGLDFAPPKRFRDPESSGPGSDAGSIRSQRSGISAAHSAAIRNGAGRVSRLPGDTVFTHQALQDQLRPQWNYQP